jgi:phage shock protein PspC (stress-responsive transcriptional regulator)
METNGDAMRWFMLGIFVGAITVSVYIILSVWMEWDSEIEWDDDRD